MKNALLFAVAATMLAGLTACDGDEAPQGCKRDFDCRVGQVCDGATADADGTCAAAGEGAERDFGEVSMDFSTGDEAYLLAVYALPRDAEAASTDLVRFELSAGGAPAGALTLAPARRPARTLHDAARWEDQLAFDAQRRAGIDRLIEDLQAGRRSLQRAMPRQAGCGNCDTGQVCWEGGCTDAPVAKFKGPAGIVDLPCVVVDVVSAGGLEVDVLLDADATGAGTASAALASASAFAASAAKVQQALGLSGHTAALDRNTDGRMTVIFTDRVHDYGAVVGFFQYLDFLPTAEADATGNEADILWARVPGAQTIASCAAGGGCGSEVITQELAAGTLVHEYTHLANFATRVYAKGAGVEDNEVLWLDEGMAHLMEDLSGYGASNIEVAATALEEWPTTAFASPEDSVPMRGQAYLLLRHIIDRQAAGATNASTVSLADVMPRRLLAEDARGFLHSVFAEGGAEGLWKWLLATYATNNPDVAETAAHAFDYLPVGTAATGQLVGFDPFGDSYVNARGTPVPALLGPALGDGSTSELSDFSTPFSSDVAVSGSFLFLVTGLDAAATVTGRGEAQTDLQLRAIRVR